MPSRPPEPLAIDALQPWNEGQPVVLGLVGPGAKAFAAEQMLRAEAVPSMAMGELPEGRRVAWFDDGLGHVGQAGVVVAGLDFFRTPWLVLLTGEALDGPHPDAFTTWSVSERTGAGASPTTVSLPWADGEDLGAFALAREAQGDLLAAAEAVRVLGRTDPGGARRLRWLALHRLFAIGRVGDVIERGFAGSSTDDDRGRVLQIVSAALFEQGAVARARDLCMLGAQVADAETRAELLLFLRYLQGVPIRVEGRTWTSPFRQSEWLGLQLAASPKQPLEFPDLPVAEALRATALAQPTEATERCFLRLGLVQHAAGARAQRGGWVAVAHYLQTEPLERIRKARSALQRGDAAAARAVLEHYPWDASRTVDRRSRFVSLLSLAAHAGSADRAAIVAARIRAMALVDPHIRARFLPKLVEVARSYELFGAFAVLEVLLERATEEVHPQVRTALQALPSTPVVLGDLLLTQRLAEGGMGVVWAGEHASLGTRVAVKLLHADVASDAPSLQAFRQEVEVTTRLEHPAIVAVLDVGVVGPATELQSGGVLTAGQPYLVMEYIAGGTLQSRLGKLPWSGVQSVVRALLEALAYAHGRGVLHRDIKPLNVLVDSPESCDGIRLADFGLSALERHTVGTPSFMAPELFRGQTATVATDLYALGCLAWSLVCGRPPIPGSVSTVAAAHLSGRALHFTPVVAVPESLEAWLRRLLARDVSERPPSAWDALQAFGAIEGAPVPPAASVGRRAAAAETFAWDTLVDLPDLTRLETEEVPRPFEPPSLPPWSEVRRVRVLRPRLPTERLVDRGDPPLFGNEDVARDLWELLREVVSTREGRDVVLEGEEGLGRGALLALVRARGRTAGLSLHDRPVPGRLALLRCEGEPVAAVGPQLRVWTGPGAPDGSPVLRLRRLGYMESLFQVRSRVPASFRLASRIAWEGLGIPELTVGLLQGLRRTAGLTVSSDGLELLQEPVSFPEELLPWVRRVTRSLMTEERRALHLAAMLAPGFTLSTWRRACEVAGLSVSDDVVLRLARVWREEVFLSRVVRAYMLESGRPLELERAAAAVEHGPRDGRLRQLAHQARLDDVDACRALEQELAEQLALSGLPLLVDAVDALESALDLRLEGTPAVRQLVTLCRLRNRYRDPPHWTEVDGHLDRVAREADARGDARIAALAWHVRLLVRHFGCEDPLDLDEAQARVLAGPPLTAAFGMVVLVALRRRRGEDVAAHEELARQLAEACGVRRERVLTQLAFEMGVVSEEHLLACLAVEQDPFFRAALMSNCAHLQLLHGDRAGAYQSLVAATSESAPAHAWLNRLALEVADGEGDREAIASLAMYGVTQVSPMFARLALVLLLGASASDWDDAEWWDLADAVGVGRGFVVSDPVLVSVLRDRAALAVPDRRAALQALASG